MRRRKVQRTTAETLRRDFSSLGWPVLLVLCTALVLGGGGSRYGILNLAVQMVALGLLCWFHANARHSARSLGFGIAALVSVTIALPLLQLIPLPAGLWQGMPGRELATESRGIIGVENGWFPLSLDRGRTITAFASLIPPLAILLLLRAPDGERGFSQAGLRLLVMLALANLLLGAFQIATGGVSPLPYPIIDDSRSYGFFANHNSSGLFSVIALCALAGVRFSEHGVVSPRAARFLLGALLVIATVLTQSRSSTALLLLPLGFFAFRWFLAERSSMTRKKVIGAAVGLGAVALLGGYLLSETRMSATFDRFENLEDARPDLWRDGLVSAERFFPVGSGMGTFDEVYQLDESLETLTPAFARRAHNDYIEIAVEAGVLGLAIVIAWFIWGSVAWLRALGSGRNLEGAAAGLALLCIALQSGVDYPLRNQALLCVAALLVAMLARPMVKSRVR